MQSKSIISLFYLCLLLLNAPALFADSPREDTALTFPFSTDSTHITVWNGEYYSPLFIKGTNLGVAVPGTFPGELAATREDYARWFQLIRDAGFNSIRIYTLHYPRFYEELKKFNEANPNHPLYVFKGVWLEEEAEDYDQDLFTLTDLFDQEIRENVRSVHGNISISPRFGKAFGEYTADISPWVIGYIIGREIHPPEVLHTNESHPSVTSYEGEYLSIDDTRASEAWLVERMDYLLQFEMSEYGTQRPVSASSWPTLDPLEHPFEQNEHEVMASVDFRNVDYSNAEAGFFASYHAYPYYPNYISKDPKYTPFHDHLGQNSYLGYLTHLKNHYAHFPLIIAEFGGTSSWGVAQYAHNGIHHGGYSETEQGENNIRMFKNFAQAGTGGGIQFAWLDEWFKRTWITDPLDFNPERRIIWHNVTAAEQNYGLLGFRNPNEELVQLDEFCTDCPIESIEAGADYAYLKLQLNIPRHIGESDTVWVGLDTYDATLGESVMPNGQSVENRVEFALMITNYKAELFVTQAYDIFGIWHNVSGDKQLYRSIPTDGAPWELVRWKNDAPDNEVQDIGSIGLNRLDLPKKTTDGVRLFDDRIEIRLPWHLLNYTDPSSRQVLHDDRNTAETGTRISDGINVALIYSGFSVETSERYVWPTWNHALGAEEYKKNSYFVMKEALPGLPGNPIAKTDHYQVGTGGTHHTPADVGVLTNDVSLDGTPMEAVLHETPQHGTVQLQHDGSFTYRADAGYTGEDVFTYRVRAGANWSDPVSVFLSVEGEPRGSGFVNLYPNPTNNNFTISSSAVIDYITIHSIHGQQVYRQEVSSTSVNISLDNVSTGIYYARVYSGNDFHLRKFTLVR